MGSVRRNAPSPSNCVARCGFAVIIGFVSTGCAGVGTFRGSDYPFLGGFWDYGKPTETLPGGDHYAQQMNEGRARAAARQAQAEGNPSIDSKETDSPKDREQAPSAKPEDSRPRLTSARPRGDDAIRVTLGRPESLPVIAGAPRAASPKRLTASNSPGWKKESPEPEDPVTPELEPEPAPKPVELARAPVARKKYTKPAKAEELAPLSQSNEEKVAEILERAKVKLNALNAYQVSMSRVERVGGKLQPQEDVLLSIRRSPQAVRLQWEKGPSKGREVIYSTALDERMIHVNMANAAIPLPRMSISVDSPLVTKKSRHSIKEAGFDTILAHMSESSSPKDDQGSSGGKVIYEGVVKPEDAGRACHRFVRLAPNGEKWEVLLDTQSLLPCSVVAHDAAGELLEQYTYRDLKENPVELARADAFDPDSRWGKPKGLFSRLAGAAAAAGGGQDSSTSTTR